VGLLYCTLPASAPIPVRILSECFPNRPCKLTYLHQPDLRGYFICFHMKLLVKKMVPKQEIELKGTDCIVLRHVGHRDNSWNILVLSRVSD
jgi:hypothetical protein